MTESDAGASFVGPELENIFVTLETAAVLTNFSPAYIERLCRDGYIPCAGGKESELFPNIAELLKVLNITLAPGTVIDYVHAADIIVPHLSREQLLDKHESVSGRVVGNMPVGISAGASPVSAPLKRGALSFDLVSDEEEASAQPEAKVQALPPPPPQIAAVLETPPSPPPKALPEHWPVKTSSDATLHFDNAPLMPPLGAKSAPLTKPEPVAIIEQPEMLPAENPEEALAPLPIHAIAEQSKQEIVVAPNEALARPAEEELMIPEKDELMVAPSEELMIEPEHALLEVPQGKEVILAPDQNLIQKAVESIDVGEVHSAEETDEHAAVFPPSVEQVSTVADAHWYTPRGDAGILSDEEPSVDQVSTAADADLYTPNDDAGILLDELQNGAEENSVEQSATQPAANPPSVIINPAPPIIEEGISDRILEEAARSNLAPELPPDNQTMSTQAPGEPIIAVPHYAVAQLTPSMHPLALPPRVVPFATMVPAAYPQVAAVFTQPHARAAEWLPWMRTSHFSRTAVQTATNPEVHPSYPRYSKHAASYAEHAESLPVTTVAPKETVGAVQAAPQKVFVSVVGKPIPPVSIPVVPHVPQVEAPPRPPVAPAQDAWDEMIAPQAVRTQAAQPVIYEEVPQKSREELLREVSADIKDSWDASFLTGLGTA